MERCKDCAYFEPKTNIKGVCVISKTGYMTHPIWYNACRHFCPGKYNGEDPAELKMKIIKDNICKYYKGGRFG